MSRRRRLGALFGHLRARVSRLDQRSEFAAGRFAGSTVAKFLDSVTDGANEQVSAEPWRLAPIEPPPLFAQFVWSEIAKRLKPSRHLEVARYCTGCFAFGQTSVCQGS
jgi:hypothetical protein